MLSSTDVSTREASSRLWQALGGLGGGVRLHANNILNTP